MVLTPQFRARPRHEEAARHLAAADVSVAEGITTQQMVDLQLCLPPDLHKAARIHAASKLVPEVRMTNNQKIAMASEFKSQLKASVTHLDKGQANHICSTLMKAVVDQLGIQKAEPCIGRVRQ